MQNIEFILDEAKQKIEVEFTKARWKTWRFLLFVTFVFTFFFIGWVGCLGFPRYLFWGMSVIAPIVFYFIARQSLPARFWQVYYENGLASLQNTPQTATNYVTRAITFFELNYPEAAVEDIRTALEMEPYNLDHWDDIIGILWYEMENGEEALPYVERMAEIEGIDQAEALMIRGQILATTDPETALASFDKAIELEPDEVDCRLARLRLLINTDRLRDAAIVIDEMSNEIQKSSFTTEKAKFAELQGILAMKQKDPEAAVKHFSKAIRFWSDNGKYYTLRADAYDALGNVTKANADRQIAEKLSKRGRDLLTTWLFR